MPSDADPQPPLPVPAEPQPAGVAADHAPGALPAPEALPVAVVPPDALPPPDPPAPPLSVMSVPSFMVPVGERPVSLVAPPVPRRRASTGFLIVVTVLSLTADLVTKSWAKSRLSGFDTKAHGMKKLEVLKDHLEFIFAQNPGGAWSFLRGLPDSLRRPFFLVVSAAAIVFIISIYQRVHRDQSAMKWGLPLALGGAMGNLVDRIRYGWVVDFIDFSMRWGGREHHWPTFNVADIAIVLGVGLMAIDMLRSRGLHDYDDHAVLHAHAHAGRARRRLRRAGPGPARDPLSCADARPPAPHGCPALRPRRPVPPAERPRPRRARRRGPAAKSPRAPVRRRPGAACLRTASAQRTRDPKEPERIGVKHVLVKYGGAKNAPASITRSREDACLRAIEVRDKLAGGADFDSVVGTYSDETGAASRGGSLGQVERRELAPPFADAAFELAPRQLSDVVESPFGFHVILRTE